MTKKPKYDVEKLENLADDFAVEARALIVEMVPKGLNEGDLCLHFSYILNEAFDYHSVPMYTSGQGEY